MGNKLYVYSTLTNDQRYRNYAQGGKNDMPRPIGEVFIAGGTGVATNDNRMWTPRGVVTEITEEDRAILENNSDFKLHRENGFVEISEVLVDPEKAAADMTGRDESAPLVPQDLPEDMQPKIPNVITDGATGNVQEAVHQSQAVATAGKPPVTHRKR